ncbi:hypothetical protein M3N55_12220 [Roseibaca sp. V10]|uniref:Uncharacterized protein n=1 Tax=Roseinatronobacter domitianus TaxID=2940293 RepID=A0ABT0M3R2_9RHOB|nr:hypothetical protein [Roseibaca domitiana]MCL1629497.1 hypothetical protein [Roseibaca domitiana]
MEAVWGVWGGRVGDVEIRMCAQSEPGQPFNDDCVAIYTTQDYNIELLDRESSTTWSPRLAREQIVSLAVLEDGSVRLERSPADLWSGVPLAPIDGPADTRPCVSDAFNAPRIFLPDPVTRPAEMDGVPYEVVSIIDPSGHGEVTTFRLPGTGAGIAAINARLTEALPQAAEEAPYYACTLDALQVGAGSFWEHQIQPEWITDRFIVVEDVEDVFCGGARPSYAVDWRVFDVETGDEIDTSAWIREDAFYDLGPYAGQGPEIGDSEVARGFRELMVEAFAATNPSQSCQDLLDLVETWDVRPSREGLVLTPSDDLGPARGCAIGLSLSVEAITPYLTDAGTITQGYQSKLRNR